MVCRRRLNTGTSACDVLESRPEEKCPRSPEAEMTAIPCEGNDKARCDDGAPGVMGFAMIALPVQIMDMRFACPMSLGRQPCLTVTSDEPGLRLLGLHRLLQFLEVFVKPLIHHVPRLRL